MSWEDRSACGPDTAHLFFPQDKVNAAMHVRQAKAICAGCPVLVECREEALSPDNPIGVLLFGVWGGMSMDERVRLIRRRRAEARRAVAA